MKKVVIAGGTGFIGQALQNYFEDDGYKVLVISRSGSETAWDKPQSLIRALDGCEVLINLAGTSVNCRFTEKNKAAILSSRLKTTSALHEAIVHCKIPPKLWINASGGAIYDSNQGHPCNENSATNGEGFMAEVARQWEHSFFAKKMVGVRQIALRISLVLGKSGGVLPIFKRLTSLGLGGKAGSGQQVMSWIHIVDFYRIIRFVMLHAEISGAVNCTSPQPLKNSAFMKAIRQNMGVPVGMPAMGWMIRMAGPVIGFEADLVLRSMNITPKKMIDAGFQFRFADIDSAMTDLLKKK